MASTLDRLRAMTTVAANTGDFDVVRRALDGALPLPAQFGGAADPIAAPVSQQMG